VTPDQVRALNRLYGPQRRDFPVRGFVLVASFLYSCYLCGVAATAGLWGGFAVFFAGATLLGLRIRHVLYSRPRKVCAKR
jgi:hypothetical protein